MCLQRNCDLNECTFAVASNLFVWLPSVACTISFQNNRYVVGLLSHASQNNSYVVMNKYFTDLSLEHYKFLVLLNPKWEIFEYFPSLEPYKFIIGYIIYLLSRILTV